MNIQKLIESFENKGYKHHGFVLQSKWYIAFDGFETMELSLMQKWLREIHKLSVEVITPNHTNVGWIPAIFIIFKFGNILNEEPESSTYEEALCAGLQAAINLVP